MKQKLRWWFGTIGILIVLQFSTSVNGSLVQSVETEGSIGFTGVYEPIGTPDPKPPATGITKPGGSLPQTSSETNSWLMWLGLVLVSFVFYLRRRNLKQNTNVKKESRNYT